MIRAFLTLVALTLTASAASKANEAPTPVRAHVAATETRPYIAREAAIKIAKEHIAKEEPNIELLEDSNEAEWSTTAHLGWKVKWSARPKKSPVSGYRIYRCATIDVDILIGPSGSVDRCGILRW